MYLLLKLEFAQRNFHKALFTFHRVGFAYGDR